MFMYKPPTDLTTAVAPTAPAGHQQAVFDFLMKQHFCGVNLTGAVGVPTRDTYVIWVANASIDGTDDNIVTIDIDDDNKLNATPPRTPAEGHQFVNINGKSGTYFPDDLFSWNYFSNTKVNALIMYNEVRKAFVIQFLAEVFPVGHDKTFNQFLLTGNGVSLTVNGTDMPVGTIGTAAKIFGNIQPSNMSGPMTLPDDANAGSIDAPMMEVGYANSTLTYAPNYTVPMAGAAGDPFVAPILS